MMAMGSAPGRWVVGAAKCHEIVVSVSTGISRGSRLHESDRLSTGQ